MRTAIHKGRGSAIAGGILLAVALAGFGVVVTADVANATGSGQVCGPLDSGKIDTIGDPSSVTIVAPTGNLITGYCVKAGSAKQGLGPEYVELAVPTASVTILHSSGKDVSHYSYSYKPVVNPPIEEPPVEEPPVEEPPVEEPPVEEPPVEEPPVEEPPVEEPPVVVPPVVQPPAPPVEPTLPVTGPGVLFGLIAAAAALLTASGAVIIRSIRKKLAVPTN